VQRHVRLLSAWQIPPPKSLRLEIAADPALADAAVQLLPTGRVVCHLGTSQPCKEWPLDRWREFHQLARAAGFSPAYSSGPSPRERALPEALKKMEPDIFVVPPVTSLPLFLAVLQRARVVVAGDTGPLHFAAGLGVPVVGLFGTADSLLKAAPIYAANQVVKSGETPPADADPDRSRLADIRPEQVLAALRAQL
jgi:ADP-heptose:LPS heptosyltransferase